MTSSSSSSTSSSASFPFPPLPSPLKLFFSDDAASQQQHQQQQPPASLFQSAYQQHLQQQQNKATSRPLHTLHHDGFAFANNNNTLNPLMERSPSPKSKRFSNEFRYVAPMHEQYLRFAAKSQQASNHASTPTTLADLTPVQLPPISATSIQHCDEDNDDSSDNGGSRGLRQTSHGHEQQADAVMQDSFVVLSSPPTTTTTTTSTSLPLHPPLPHPPILEMAAASTTPVTPAMSSSMVFAPAVEASSSSFYQQQQLMHHHHHQQQQQQADLSRQLADLQASIDALPPAGDLASIVTAASSNSASPPGLTLSLTPAASMAPASDSAMLQQQHNSMGLGLGMHFSPEQQQQQQHYMFTAATSAEQQQQQLLQRRPSYHHSSNHSGTPHMLQPAAYHHSPVAAAVASPALAVNVHHHLSGYNSAPATPPHPQYTTSTTAAVSSLPSNLIPAAPAVVATNNGLAVTPPTAAAAAAAATNAAAAGAIPLLPAPRASEMEIMTGLEDALLRIDFNDITVSELKDMLRQRGKPATGKKVVLMERLRVEIQEIRQRRNSLSSPADYPQQQQQQQQQQMMMMMQHAEQQPLMQPMLMVPSQPAPSFPPQSSLPIAVPTTATPATTPVVAPLNVITATSPRFQPYPPPPRSRMNSFSLSSPLATSPNAQMASYQLHQQQQQQAIASAFPTISSSPGHPLAAVLTGSTGATGVLDSPTGCGGPARSRSSSMKEFALGAAALPLVAPTSTSSVVSSPVSSPAVTRTRAMAMPRTNSAPGAIITGMNLDGTLYDVVSPNSSSSPVIASALSAALTSPLSSSPTSPFADHQPSSLHRAHSISGPASSASSMSRRKSSLTNELQYLAHHNNTHYYIPSQLSPASTPTPNTTSTSISNTATSAATAVPFNLARKRSLNESKLSMSLSRLSGPDGASSMSSPGIPEYTAFPSLCGDFPISPPAEQTLALESPAVIRARAESATDYMTAAVAAALNGTAPNGVTVAAGAKAGETMSPPSPQCVLVVPQQQQQQQQ
ncbi:hypothetical protein RI367_008618 [Sorochytrium milnesiophthora]